MSDFDESVREYYARAALRPQRAESILAQGRAATRARRSWLYRLAGMAAVLALGLFGVQRQLGDDSVVPGLLAEVAMNHQKQLGVEVASDRYQAVQAGLDRLDFPVLPARQGLLENYGLLGGRYCSIRGNLAAQLKVRDRVSGRVLTLYVTPLTEALSDHIPLEREFEQVRIRMWEDNGRLFVLAGDLELAPSATASAHR